VPPSAVDNARSAVENAIAGGAYDPAFPTPVAALNAQPMGPELHQDNSNIPTPSLPLPTNGTAPQSADPAPPAPPAVPPPLPMNSAAVAALPPAAGQSLF
ncbi:MAG TPA: hypothetical protein VEH48_01935, partial [Candidatus Nitrosopolaris sp.]|nr:hypothetical protein [Candidatus Nitrosopolaris sp.]